MYGRHKITQSHTDRYEFIVFLRAIAPLLVLWAHLGEWLPLALNIHWRPTQLWVDWVTRPLYLYQSGGHLGVILFFLISGYVVTHSSMREGVYSFLIRRAFRLLPMLVLALVFAVLVAAILSALQLPTPLGVGSTSPRDFALNAVLLTWLVDAPYVLSVTWTLFIEVVFYALTAAIIPATSRWPFATSAIALAVTSAFIAFGWKLGLHVELLVYLPILLVGRLVYFASRSFAWRWAALICGAWVAFVALYILINGDYLWTFAQPPLLTYVYAFAIFLLAARLVKWTPGPLRFVADTSYSLYLLHLPIGSLLGIILTAMGVNFSIVFVLVIIACLTTSWIFYTLIEKPMQRHGRMLSVGKLPSRMA